MKGTHTSRVLGGGGRGGRFFQEGVAPDASCEHLLEYTVDSPVTLLIFNRPETTRRVFAEVAKVRPGTLLVVADGPRPGKRDDLEKCKAARNIVEHVDWDCRVLRDYSDVNLGCRDRVSSGLGWVFQNVDRAIILEDDCLPHPTFFRFCDELLDRYADDDRIASISGNNFNRQELRSPYSYRFSMFPLIWGWASWARVWKNYDVNMSQLPRFLQEGRLVDLLGDAASVRYWKNILRRVYERKIDTWDYQFTFSCWLNGQLHIVPQVNLVSNIGYQTDATHTTGPPDWRTNLPVEPMSFPLSHPPFVIRHAKADNEIKRRVFHTYPMGGTSLARLIRGIRRLVHTPKSIPQLPAGIDGQEKRFKRGNQNSVAPEYPASCRALDESQEAGKSVTYYDEQYFDWQENIGVFGGKVDLFKFLPYIGAEDTVLDFGCGGGDLLNNMPCKEKAGIEINPAAREHAARFGFQVFSQIGEVPDSFASVVISNHALEHVESPFDVVRSLRAKMKRSARCVFVVPHQKPNEPYSEEDVNRHLYTWNPMTLGNLFRAAGYADVRVDVIRHRWVPYYDWVHSLFGDAVFHILCKLHARLKRDYQIRITARNPGSQDPV